METAAIVGAGASGLLHALAYRAHGVRVAQVMDPCEEKASALASMCGARVVSAIEEIATDIVSITSPPAWHVEQAMALRERIVLVEKPVAVSGAGLDALLGHPRCIPIVQWRAGRALRAVRSAIGRGLLGRRPSVAVDLAWSRDAAYFAARPNWGCGALLSVGIHAVDAVTWALGARPMRVTCERDGDGDGDGNGDERGETEASLAIRYSNDSLVSLRLTFHAGPDRTRISFAGNGVTAVIEGEEADPTASAVQWNPPSPAMVHLESTAGGSPSGPLIVPFIGDVLRCLRAGEPPVGIADVAAAHRALIEATVAGDGTFHQ